ncbi:hypothetical protein AAVH_41731, partial [Aphelenchoides avenae]
MAKLNPNVTEDYLDGFAGTLGESHNREVYLYQTLKQCNMPVGLPKVYAFKTCGELRGQKDILETYMLMEDLGIHGVSADMVAGMNKAQMENVIRGIASFHASSLALPNRDEILKTIRPTKPLDKE